MKHLQRQQFSFKKSKASLKIINQVRDLSEISSGGEGAETDERRLTGQFSAVNVEAQAQFFPSNSLL